MECRDRKSNGQLERPVTAYHRTEASYHAATEPTKACLSAFSSKCATPPISPKCPSDKGSKNQVQTGNVNALHKNSGDSETDRLQDIQEEPRRCIGPSCVKVLAKFFTPSSDEEDHSHVNTRTRCKKLFEPKEKEGGSEK